MDRIKLSSSALCALDLSFSWLSLPPLFLPWNQLLSVLFWFQESFSNHFTFLMLLWHVGVPHILGSDQESRAHLDLAFRLFSGEFMPSSWSWQNGGHLLIFSQDLCLEYLIDVLDKLLAQIHLYWTWFTSILIRFVDLRAFLGSVWTLCYCKTVWGWALVENPG